MYKWVFLAWVGSVSAVCPAHCFANYCDKNGNCGSCSGPWWGPTCSSECPEHCWTGQCNMKTGKCSSCSGPWWGLTCGNPCPEHCWTGQCDMTTGKCSSCSGPWWGPTCSNPCPEHCWVGQCNMKSGCCGSCTDKYSGNCTCSIPHQCATPTGTNCSWYSTCLASRTPNCPDITNIMMAKCEEYEQLQSSLSPQGLQWSKNVRKCVMTALAKKALLPSPSGQVTCNTATGVFFGEHIDCYVKGPVSFCDLPHWDIPRIIFQAKGIIFTRHWYEPLSTGAQLGRICGQRFWATGITKRGPTRGLSSETSCDPQNLAQALKQAMIPQQWSAELFSIPNVETEGLFYLLSGQKNATVNDTLAESITLNVLATWLQNNPNCQATFNGQPVAEAPRRSTTDDLMETA